MLYFIVKNKEIIKAAKSCLDAVVSRKIELVRIRAEFGTEAVLRTESYKVIAYRFPKGAHVDLETWRKYRQEERTYVPRRNTTKGKEVYRRVMLKEIDRTELDEACGYDPHGIFIDGRMYFGSPLNRIPSTGEFIMEVPEKVWEDEAYIRPEGLVEITEAKAQEMYKEIEEDK